MTQNVPPSGWTIDTLKEYICALGTESNKRYEDRFTSLQRAMDSALAAQKEAVSMALSAADRAVTKAELASEKRFENVNEFRSTLDDQQRTLIPRSEALAIIGSLSDRTTALQKQVDNLLSERAGVKGGWGYAVGLIGAVLSVLSVVAVVVVLVRT